MQRFPFFEFVTVDVLEKNLNFNCVDGGALVLC